MADLFATGRVIDGILLLMLVEGAVSIALYRTLRRRAAMTDIIFNLAAGGALLLALRAALLREAWPAIAAWLIVALAAHAGEVGFRWAGAR